MNYTIAYTMDFLTTSTIPPIGAVNSDLAKVVKGKLFIVFIFMYWFAISSQWKSCLRLTLCSAMYAVYSNFEFYFSQFWL